MKEIAPNVWLEIGDGRAVLQGLPEASVDCVVTSPPYWGLRQYSRCTCSVRQSAYGATSTLAGGGNVSYGEPDPNCQVCHGSGKIPGIDKVWGGEAGCEHRWTSSVVPAANGLVHGPMKGKTVNRRSATRTPRTSQTCASCGAWYGELGLEPTPGLYVAHLVEFLEDVRRVLKPTGVLWLNLGDCYFGDSNKSDRFSPAAQDGVRGGVFRQGPGLKPKDLVGIPWGAAFALRNAGWHLRMEVIWSKNNPTPDPTKDRPTRSHESIFMLTKEARYFYDGLAVREPWRDKNPHDLLRARFGHKPYGGKIAAGNVGMMPRVKIVGDPTGGRNLRSVWTTSTSSYKGAHYATFPPAIVAPCVLSSCPAKVCAKCGAPYARLTKRLGSTSPRRNWKNPGKSATVPGMGTRGLRNSTAGASFPIESLGWQPTCKCVADVVPGTVLDPFAGSGTVGQVARFLGRRALLVDIIPSNEWLIRDRVRRNLTWRPGSEESPTGPQASLGPSRRRSPSSPRPKASGAPRGGKRLLHLTGTATTTPRNVQAAPDTSGVQTLPEVRHA